jgi:acetoacetate decarboxylase
MGSDGHLLGAAGPFGTSRTLSYDMRANRYTGRVLYVGLRTHADVQRWLPAPLTAVDPHAAFLKVYRLRRRPTDGDPLPPTFSQYNEVCVATLVTIPGDPTPRHYNLFMWLDRDWAVYKYREVFGWPKKLATIDITDSFRGEVGHDHDLGSVAYAADVVRHGFPLLRIRAQLDGSTEYTPPPFDGFYAVRHIAASDGDPSRAVSELLQIMPEEGWAGPITTGSATVESGSAPDEEPDALGIDTEVTGCALMDVGWVLPAWPATRRRDLPPRIVRHDG